MKVQVKVHTLNYLCSEKIIVKAKCLFQKKETARKMPKIVKTAKIGTLRLVFRVTRASVIKFCCLSQQQDMILLERKVYKEISKTCRDILKKPRTSWISCIPSL